MEVGLERFLFGTSVFQENKLVDRFGVRAGFVAGLLLCAAVMPWMAGGASAQAASEQTVAEKIAAAKDLLDINTATPAQLKALPGMGDAYVARVIAGRPYTAKNQLVQRGILPAEAYEKIKALIIAHRPKT
jgi:DNA uptake protein ComE-like DNA-binding protein